MATPTTPTLLIVNDETGTSVTATVGGDAGVTNSLYYRRITTLAWTAGLTRVDDGDIQQTGLVANALYEFVAVSDLGGYVSLPSSPVTVRTAVSGGAYPVVERIAQALLVALGEIVTAGDATAAKRPLKQGLDISPQDKLLVLTQGAGEVDAEQGDTGAGPVGRKSWAQDFTVWCYAMPSDASTTAVDSEVNTLRAKVEAKLRETPYWGGLAQDTRIQAAEPFESMDGSCEGVAVNCEVLYRTLEDDPYTLG